MNDEKEKSDFETPGLQHNHRFMVTVDSNKYFFDSRKEARAYLEKTLKDGKYKRASMRSMGEREAVIEKYSYQFSK